MLGYFSPLCFLSPCCSAWKGIVPDPPFLPCMERQSVGNEMSETLGIGRFTCFSFHSKLALALHRKWHRVQWQSKERCPHHLTVSLFFLEKVFSLFPDAVFHSSPFAFPRTFHWACIFDATRAPRLPEALADRFTLFALLR